jgi:peptide/nickel transport system ATP-binding protein
VSYLFITHDLSIVPGLAHQVGVMQLGKLVEQGSAEQILTAPRHPYTRALLASVPRIDP